MGSAVRHRLYGDVKQALRELLWVFHRHLNPWLYALLGDVQMSNIVREAAKQLGVVL